MVRNIVLVVVLCVLFYFGFRWYQQHRATTQATNGEFTCQGCLSPEEEERYKKENSGETADGNSEHKQASARIAAVDAETGQPTGGPAEPGAPVAAPTTATPSVMTGTSSMQAPVPTGYPPSSAMNNAPVVVPTTVQPGATPSGIAPPVQPSVPTTDTQAANAPNGMRFGGSGSYLVYRQGNITYRLDTSTGRSCVIYATMEEWRKQIVMSHGCGRTA